MKEEDAKKKWCPMASSRAIKAECKDGYIETAKWNAGGKGISTLCIASDCMMWIEGASEDAIAQAKGAGFGIPKGGHCGLINKG